MEYLLSILAIILSLISLVVAIWLENNARKRELLFKSYDRLAELAIVTQKNIARRSKLMEDAKNAKSDAESTDILVDFRNKSMNEATNAWWSIKLHRFALSKEVIASLKRDFEVIYEKHMLWEEAAKEQKATEDHALDFAYAVDDFWDTLENVVDTALTEIAQRLRY
ncbi:MAG: hypothetical protein OXC57_12315 [Rhodobacteraceae bacterium]|nr:hypothetical protein [Paracoccaceae bacterium]